MERIEYRVRPVTRYMVTRWQADENGASAPRQMGTEYDNAQVAYDVAYALCKTEHERLGWPVGDDRIQYPEPIDPRAGVYRAMLKPPITLGDLGRLAAGESPEFVLGAPDVVIAVPVGKLGLPQWKCHKIVGAAQITDIRPNTFASGWNLTLDFGDGVAHEQFVDTDWSARHRPLVGGYFVEYEDGYTSFSPAEAFEKGYTRL